MPPARIERIPVTELEFDPQNPRLPESLQDSTQEEILRHLFNQAALHELAMSFIDNGYFEHEPLIVSPRSADRTRKVLEGNRRLAALTILLYLPPAEDEDLAFTMDPPPTGDQLNALREVPCYVVEDLGDVHRFLGFRHIGGIKTWSAEAKARYLLNEVRRAHESHPSDNAFTVVGRQVGSNALGVRNPYIAMKILVFARQEFGIDVTPVQHRRFGVWNRAMNSPDLRNYIGLGDPRTYAEVEDAITKLSQDKLREVLLDLTPRPNARRAVLADSRDVTVYAAVLQHETAHQVLRDTHDLRLARQIVDYNELHHRIEQIARNVSILNEEVDQEGASVEALEPSNDLHRRTRNLVVLVKAAVNVTA